MRKLWGGAFATDSADLVDAFGQSIASDMRFWREDVQGSIAHARMLGSQGILSESESATLIGGLELILSQGPERLPTDVEDIHTAVEVLLHELVGAVAGKLHTARSRNDQVATDGRLHLRNRIDETLPAIKSLQSLLLDLAGKHRKTLLTGYTHQQPAQPITLGFHLMAHWWAFQRDGWRFERVRQVVNLSPLGSAALAGTGFPIDRDQTAKELGFAGPIPNALDATSDRSFVLDALHATAMTMLDLSRIAQELVLWSGAEFGYVRLSDSVTTGSSIMPQKRNPDMAELIRGRTSRAIGNWTAFAATMKALPLGYNRDTQDDKPALFEGLDLMQQSLKLVEIMAGTAEWQPRAMLRGNKAELMATDLADQLATSGIPFRLAHEIVGEYVRGGASLEALNRALTGRDLPPFDPAAFAQLTPAEGVRRRESLGGPGPRAFAAQLRRARVLQKRPGFDHLA